jgi:hypothetical protein
MLFRPDEIFSKVTLRIVVRLIHGEMRHVVKIFVTTAILFA